MNDGDGDGGERLAPEWSWTGVEVEGLLSSCPLPRPLTCQHFTGGWKTLNWPVRGQEQGQEQSDGQRTGDLQSKQSDSKVIDRCFKSNPVLSEDRTHLNAKTLESETSTVSNLLVLADAPLCSARQPAG